MASHLARKRRSLGLLVAFGAFVATARVTKAQQTTKFVRIGVLGNEDSPPWEAFRRALRELGYVEGRNLVIESRWSGGLIERLPALAGELVARNCDVIVASGNQAVRAAMEATSTVPIVMAVSGYPDKMGLIQSLARPGGNVTGLSNIAFELQGKRLELLKEAAPTVARVAWFWNPSSPFEATAPQALSAIAASSGLTIQLIEVRTPSDFAAAFATAVGNGIDALMALGNPVNFKGRRSIADFALEHRLPSIFEERLFVEAGGLMSYGPSFIDLFRRAAVYVDKILKGAKPADLPVEQPVKFELVINQKTAKDLGLKFPTSLLLRADHVIE